MPSKINGLGGAVIAAGDRTRCSTIPSSEITAPPEVSAWIIGRGYCPVCQVVKAIVRDPAAVDVRCARCGTLVELEATGDEA